MSNPMDLQFQRYYQKVIEARRLLGAREYRASIAACNEAIELVPGTRGAYQTRAEAFRCLGMTQQAAADSMHLSDRPPWAQRSGTVEHGTWYYQVIAVWRQVANEIGAVLEFQESFVGQRTWKDAPQAPAVLTNIVEGTLELKTQKGTLTLECRAEKGKVTDDDGGVVQEVCCAEYLLFAATCTAPGFRFKFPTGESDDFRMLEALLADTKIRELMPRSLSGFSLVLEQSRLVLEQSQISICEFLVPNQAWPLILASRVKALIELFQALLVQLDQIKDQGLAN